MTTPPTTPADPQALRGFYGLLEHWDAVHGAGWLPELVAWEQSERQRRSLERRLRNARLGRFQLLADLPAAWAGGGAPRASAASSCWPTSTGPGPRSSTASRSRIC